MVTIFGFAGGQYVTDNIHYRWIVNEWDRNAIVLCNPKVKDLGPINGLAGMGVPADQGTAQMSGQAWPAKGPAA